MADRTDSANARGDAGHFVIRAAFGKFFEAANLGDMKFGSGNTSLVIELDINFRVSLDAADRFNRDALHDHSLSKLDLEVAVRLAALQQVIEQSDDVLGRRGAAGQVEIHFYKFS